MAFLRGDFFYILFVCLPFMGLSFLLYLHISWASSYVNMSFETVATV